ncbi:hypothetical protein AB0K09_15275 [Streptomyces sp. NPDC049577]|uniref:hypothetical protein n=1 Tax=Streptomyces sp. NPDC049577 TaxID=3155153 RepID=UPI00342A323F
MKLHRARTAAVSACALAALTGVGVSGCSGDPGGQNSASGSSAKPAAGGASRADDSRDAMKDVEISECGYVDKKGIAAKVSAINGDATVTYSYEVTVNFTAADGTSVGTQTTSLPFVRPGRGDTLDVMAPYTPKAGASTSGVKCEVAKVVRTTG